MYDPLVKLINQVQTTVTRDRTDLRLELSGKVGNVTVVIMAPISWQLGGVLTLCVLWTGQAASTWLFCPIDHNTHALQNARSVKQPSPNQLSGK